MKYPEKNEPLTTNQYAFTRNSSPADATFDVSKYIYKAQGENEKDVTIFLKTKKSFRYNRPQLTARKIKGTGL